MNGPFYDLSQFKMADIFSATATCEETIAFCQQHGLLPLVKTCRYRRNMILQNFAGVSEGKRWKCNYRACKRTETLRGVSRGTPLAIVSKLT